MKILRLTFINLRRLLRNPIMLMMCVAIPLVFLFMMGGSHSESGEKILLVDRDSS